MSVELVVGTQLRVSTSAPATYDAAGYAALTYTKVAEITDTGEHGPTLSITDHVPVDTGIAQQFPGTTSLGQKTLTLGQDRTDAGQAILKTALNNKQRLSVEIEYPGGDFDYFPAYVTSFTTTGGDGNAVRGGSVTLAITTSKTGIGIVEVNAPAPT